MAKTTPKAPQGKKPEATGTKKRSRIAYIWIAVGLIALNLGTGIFTYAGFFVWCMGPPVTASKFAASYTYSKFGQAGYGPGPFKEYFCTEQDAKNANFHPHPWAD